MTDEAMPQTDEGAVGGWKFDSFATRTPRSEGIEQMRKARAGSAAGHCLMWACIGLVSLAHSALAADFEDSPVKAEIEEESVDVLHIDATAGATPLVSADNAGNSGDASDAATGSAPPGGEHSTGIADSGAASEEEPAAPAPATASPQSTERIEEALDEAVTPLDSVAFSIEHGELEGTEEFLNRYISAVESAHHRYHPGLVRPLILPWRCTVGSAATRRGAEHLQPRFAHPARQPWSVRP